MGTMPGIGLERLPTGALCSPPIHSVSGEATKDPDLPNPKPSRPPWRATSAAKNGHRAGSLSRGRAPGAALQHATHSSPATPAPSSQQTLTIVSGRHKTQLWATVSPSGLAETSSELHRCPSLLLPTSPSFPFSFQRRRPAHALKACLACPCSPPLSFTSVSPKAPLTLGVCFPEDPTNTPSDLHLTMTWARNHLTTLTDGIQGCLLLQLDCIDQ